MENAMQAGQPKAVATKEQIAAYVKDMAEIEEREFLLRKASKKLQDEAYQLNQREHHSLNRAKNALQNAKERSLSYETTHSKSLDESCQPIKPPQYDEFKKMEKSEDIKALRVRPAFLSRFGILGLIFIFVIPVLIDVTMAALNIPLLSEAEAIPVVITLFILWPVVAILLTIHALYKNRKKLVAYHSYLQMEALARTYENDLKQQQTISDCQAQLKKQVYDCQAQFEKQKVAAEQADQKCELMQAQASILYKQANTIAAKKTEALSNRHHST